MADITLSVDTADVDTIVELFEYAYGPRDDLVETKAQFIGRHMKERITNWLKQQHSRKAQEDDFTDWVVPIITVS